MQKKSAAIVKFLMNAPNPPIESGDLELSKLWNCKRKRCVDDVWTKVQSVLSFIKLHLDFASPSSVIGESLFPIDAPLP